MSVIRNFHGVLKFSVGITTSRRMKGVTYIHLFNAGLVAVHILELLASRAKVVLRLVPGTITAYYLQLSTQNSFSDKEERSLGVIMWVEKNVIENLMNEIWVCNKQTCHSCWMCGDQLRERGKGKLICIPTNWKHSKCSSSLSAVSLLSVSHSAASKKSRT